MNEWTHHHNIMTAYLPKNYFDKKCKVNQFIKNYTNFKKTGKWKNCYQKLNQIGLYDWIQLPDKSNPFTDFAIHQLMKILFNYNDKTTPADTFVIINSCLNVIHYRGDISSIFIRELYTC